MPLDVSMLGPLSRVHMQSEKTKFNLGNSQKAKTYAKFEVNQSFQDIFQLEIFGSYLCTYMYVRSLTSPAPKRNYQGAPHERS